MDVAAGFVLADLGLQIFEFACSRQHAFKSVDALIAEADVRGLTFDIDAQRYGAAVRVVQWQ